MRAFFFGPPLASMLIKLHSVFSRKEEGKEGRAMWTVQLAAGTRG